LVTWLSSSSKFAVVYQISSKLDDFYRAMHMHSANYAMARCLSVRPSHTDIESKRLYISWKFSHNQVAPPF